MKKLLSGLLSAALIVSAMSGCSSTPSSTAAETEAPATENEAKETPAETGAPEADAGEKVVTDGEGWYLWDETGNLTLEGRDATGETAVVSAGKYEAAQAGLDVLQAGGNAVDAAVAVGFALSVVEPNSSGLGGGGFMLIRSETGESIFVDFRERAPEAATPALWAQDAEGKVIGFQNFYGGKAVGIPGEVAGLCYAFDNYGSGNLTLAEVIQPAIDLAQNGFLVTPTLYNDMSGAYDSMVTYPEFGNIFLNEDGLNYQVGDTFVNKDMVKTLSLIAEKGRDAFYTGEMAECMVAEINKYGGVFTLDDLANYEVRTYEPVSGNYRGYTVLSSPLPSSGGTHVVEFLNILENFDMSQYKALSAESLHIMAEAFKLVYYDRSQYMGDPDYVDVPVKGLLSKEYAAEQAKKISLDSVITEFENAVDPWIYEHEDTTHFCVADTKGNVVSVTQTVNGGFGSRVAADGYGFVLNNEMGDFTAGEDSPNSIAPGKTPLSSMSPTVVLNEDGTPFMTLGSPGGTTIINAVAQVISFVIDHDMDIQDAINLPRMSQKANNQLSYEGRYDSEAEEALTALGHELSISDEWNRSFGSVQGILYGEDGLLHGGADPRRDNKALGY